MRMWQMQVMHASAAALAFTTAAHRYANLAKPTSAWIYTSRSRVLEKLELKRAQLILESQPFDAVGEDGSFHERDFHPCKSLVKPVQTYTAKSNMTYNVAYYIVVGLSSRIARLISSAGAR